MTIIRKIIWIFLIIFSNVHSENIDELESYYKILMRDQELLYKNIEEEYRGFEFDQEAPYLKLDPYGKTPLAALIKFNTEKESCVIIKVKGRNNQEDFIQEFKNYKTNHEYQVLGLYPNYENIIEIITIEKNGNENKNFIKVKTKKLPKESVTIMSTLNKDNQSDKIRYFSINAHMSSPYTVFNNKGEIRYQINNGDFFIHSPVKYKDGFLIYRYRNNEIALIDKLGKVQKIYDLKSYMPHHDLILKNKNNIIMPALKKKGESFDDVVIEYDLVNEKIIKEWNFQEILDSSRNAILKSEGDWLHTNSVYYDEKLKSLLISARHQGLFEIDYETGKLKWIATVDKGIIKKSMKSKILGGDKKYIPPLGQHNAIKLPNNNVFLFNNNGVIVDGDTRYSDSISSGIEYEIDEKNKTIKKIDEIGREEKLYSGWISGIDYNFKNKNRLILWGDTNRDKENLEAILIEYNNSKEKILEIKFSNHAGMYRAKYLENIY